MSTQLLTPGASETVKKDTESFKNKQITYELYPTLKISSDELLSFEDINTELEKGRSKPTDTSKLKVKDMPIDDLSDYFNNIRDKLQYFINSINQKIIDNKLGIETSGTNSSVSQQKDKILEEHQGLINEEINNLLVKSFKKKMRKQPNCHDEKKFRKGIKIESTITNSSELNKKIYAELEKCFEFLTKLLQEYCNQFGWEDLKVSKEMLLKKPEKQQQTTSTTSLSTTPFSTTHSTTSSTTTQSSNPNRNFPFRGGESKKKINNKKKQINKNSKKQKQIIKNTISRKSNSRYMIVSKNKK